MHLTSAGKETNWNEAVDVFTQVPAFQQRNLVVATEIVVKTVGKSSGHFRRENTLIE